MVKVLVCYNLRPEQTPQEYETWLNAEHHPKMKAIPGAMDSKTIKVGSVMQGSFPFQYIAEVTMENEMSLMMASASPQMAEMMKDWQPKVQNVTVAITKEV